MPVFPAKVYHALLYLVAGVIIGLLRYEKEEKRMMKQINLKMRELVALPAPDQIGVVVRDIQKTIETYTELFQWGPFEIAEREYREYTEATSTYHGKPGNFKYRVAYAQLGPIQLELIQPLDGRSIYDEFLETRGEGLHHFGVSIDRIEERIAALKQMGIEVLQSGERPGRKHAFMDTEPPTGIMIELREKTV
jgi:catechol 2,3-dioxygenase-like lactoylglutathione lyase family enzyme